MDLETLFVSVETAIHNHPTLLLVTHPTSPYLVLSRMGSTLKVLVKLQGSRKKPTEIWGEGDTPTEAAADLIRTLDFWAQSIR